jgi:hypothetical protein
MQQVFACIILGLLSLASCKKNDTVATSNDTTNGVPNNVVANVPEKTIDAKGGTLTLGTLAVDIPQNAITTATKITLTAVTDKPFGASQKSDIYYLNNLPDVIDQPIILSLSGFTANDKISTYLAESTFVPSLNKEVVNYRPVTNSFVNGKVQVALEANTNNKSLDLKAGTNPVSIGILAASGRSTYTSAQGHFRLTCLSTVLTDAMDIATYLEEAYSKYSTSPILLSYANRTTWPIEVSLCPLDNTLYGFMETSVWGNNSAYMCFNDTKLANKAELRITAGHEFLHLVQTLYDPRNRFSKAKFASSQLWIDEATAVWAESLFTATAGYISTIRAGNEMSPYQTLMKGGEAGASTYGYGMSSVIKYLVATYGEGIIKKIYEQIQGGQKPAEAIRLATGKLYWEWWGQLIDTNTLGKIYNDIPISGLLGNKSDAFAINAVSDSVKEYTSAYGQLQSKIAITTLNPAAVSNLSILKFQVKNPNYEMLNVYKFNNNSIELIGQNMKLVTIPDISTIIQAGYKILTTVSNLSYDYSSTATQNITLITRLVTKSIPVIDSLGCDFSHGGFYKETFQGFVPWGLIASKEYINIFGKNWSTDPTKTIVKVNGTPVSLVNQITANKLQIKIPNLSGNVTITVESNGIASNVKNFFVGIPSAVLHKMPIWVYDQYLEYYYTEKQTTNNGGSSGNSLYPDKSNLRSFTWSSNTLIIVLTNNHKATFTFSEDGSIIKTARIDDQSFTFDLNNLPFNTDYYFPSQISAGLDPIPISSFIGTTPKTWQFFNGFENVTRTFTGIYSTTNNHLHLTFFFKN